MIVVVAIHPGQRPGKKVNIFSDDDDLDDDDFADQINCFTGFILMQPQVSPSRNKPLGEQTKRTRALFSFSNEKVEGAE